MNVKQQETKHSKNIKRLKQLVKKNIPLQNDVFMIFAKNKKFCQEFLRTLLQDKKLVVIENDIQKYLPSAFNKNVTIDMLCRIGDGSLVNVEIQLTKEKEHAKRIHTYISKIRTYDIEKGEKYKDIKDIIIIYLTDEDIFKLGSTVYEVKMDIVSDQGKVVRKWDAGFKVYYINTKGLTNKTINEYLELLTDKKTLSTKYKATSNIKKELYEIGGATMSKEMEAILSSERAEGRAEGRMEGRTEGKIQVMIEMVKDKILSIADAASRLGMKESDFKLLIK